MITRRSTHTFDERKLERGPSLLIMQSIPEEEKEIWILRPEGGTISL